MALTGNQLRQQVDLPTWEWLRFSPVAPTAGLSCSCTADNSNFNATSGRYIYYLINATNFWRYDTVTDTYEQMQTPINAPVTSSSMRFAGSQGYYNRVISATSTTIVSGLPFGGSAVGFKIRIIAGKGAGQERIITAVSDPIVADYGAATSGSTTTLVDTSKTWTSGYVGAVLNVNNYVGYVVRTLFGTGPNQVRKILYNSATTLTIGDLNYVQNDVFATAVFATAPAVGTVYQIESSTITVDTAWDTTPDSTSKFVIQSGGIWLQSGAAGAPFYTLQYYDIIHDMWYVKSAWTNMVQAAPTDSSLERVTENSTIWAQGIASTGGSTTSLVDTTVNWTINQWAGYPLYIYSGTGHGQYVIITSNTATTLTFPAITTAPDTTSRYQIYGYDINKATSATYNTITTSTETWTTNRWVNYGVRILFGTGAGQMRQIASNTGTTVTTYMPWNILPDTTSVYAIQGHSDCMYFGWGGSSEVYIHNAGNADILTHGRMLDFGVTSIAAALPCDASHNIYEYAPFAISGIAGTTTITATTVQAHNFKVGQYVSIRGITSAAADQYNTTGVYQILTVPSTTTFTYTPYAAGSGAYAYLTALSTSNLSDASKDFRDNASSGTNTTITFARATPSNINGWYVTGTNVTPGTTVVSGAGTTTVTLSGGAAVPSGVIFFNPWGPTTAVTSTYSSGGGAGVATVTMGASTNANITGWYVSGTGIALGATVTNGAGTATITLSNACTGAVSGTITFYPSPIAGRMIITNTAAPVVTTGLTAGQLMVCTSSGVGGATMGFITTLGTAPTAAITRYAVTKIDMLGAAMDQTTTTYNYGIATGGSATTLVDASAFWATATGTGTAQTTTITLSAAAPGNINGWYVTGTGVNPGAIVVSGAGTTTITVNIAHSATVSGTMTFAAWNQSLVGRRLKILSGATGLNQEVIITVVAPTTGTLTFASGTAPVTNVAAYSLLSIPVKGAGMFINWAFGNSVAANRGKYLWLVRGGAALGMDRLDLTTDRVILVYPTPFFETLGSGSMYAYDGQDRMYITKEITQRMYYLDLNTNWMHGAAFTPYIAPVTVGIGNKMEIFTTADGIKYLWLDHPASQAAVKTVFHKRDKS